LLIHNLFCDEFVVTPSSFSPEQEDRTHLAKAISNSFLFKPNEQAQNTY